MNNGYSLVTAIYKNETTFQLVFVTSLYFNGGLSHGL
jgi:hypothetical protein